MELKFIEAKLNQPFLKLNSHEFNILNSISLGIAGFEKSKLGINSEEILPLYLKKPQAQRQLEEREHK